jgi:hypothetical protein
MFEWWRNDWGNRSPEPVTFGVDRPEPTETSPRGSLHKWLTQEYVTKKNPTAAPNVLKRNVVIRGPFAKFVDLPNYSEAVLCGCAVTVCFSKYLPWQAMHFLQHSTHLSKTCCRPLIASKFLASEVLFRGWKSPGIARGEIWIEFCVRVGKSGWAEPH